MFVVPLLRPQHLTGKGDVGAWHWSPPLVGEEKAAEVLGQLPEHPRRVLLLLIHEFEPELLGELLGIGLQPRDRWAYAITLPRSG